MSQSASATATPATADAAPPSPSAASNIFTATAAHVASQKAILTRTVADMVEHGHTDDMVEAFIAALEASIDEAKTERALQRIIASAELKSTREVAAIAISLIGVLRTRGVDLPGALEDEIDEGLLVLAHTKPRSPDPVTAKNFGTLPLSHPVFGPLFTADQIHSAETLDAPPPAAGSTEQGAQGQTI